MKLIELKNIEKTYGKNENKVHALNKINLTIDENEFIAFTGASGSGKTTLLNILGCMDSPDSGEYYLNDLLIKNLSNKKICEIRNKIISFIFQDFGLIQEYTAFENIELPLTYRKMTAKNKKDLIYNYAEKLGIKDKLKRKPGELSGGQQQRIAICRSLVSNSKIILADEPTGSLDKNTSLEIIHLLKELHEVEKKTVIIVTHDSTIAKFCNRIIKIEDGKIIEDKKNICL